eukprot:TRINITY_DN15332_c0_g1_i1.p1 TRINITY_DN15332_c0_g1~~TRINITY_DN15332_c0_g1_i1.p1  ORF type:complete len:745 (+),score=149.51 TRINITY_DN15332_c0_g1_i1:233-2236(+)
MDSLDLEREKGITIKSAATHVGWKGNMINIIDTPGHVDFTIEVERSLHVLDGAILVVCGVSGVQSQTMTVDRQMKRYGVPRIIFINKLDRLGADPWKALRGLKGKLGITCAAVQIPLGIQQGHSGVIDIITRETCTYEGENGEEVEISEIPERLAPMVEEKRQQLIETLADVDDEIAMKVLEGEETTVEEIKNAIRRATLAKKFIPVFMGSAFKNKGVQNLLDGVIDYLPSPLEREVYAFDKSKDGEKVQLQVDHKLPLVAYAFKIDEHKFGQLTWLRIYQGTLRKGTNIFNVNLNIPTKVPRLARMHAADLEDITDIRAGDICAMFGVDCASGETFTDGTLKYQMTPMHIPDPVISLSVEPKAKTQVQNFTRALKRFQREDPTFRVSKDAETNETIISGMGELHLEIYVERMRREYDLPLNVGKPRVNYRETITRDGKFDYTHKRQTGGAGQYAKIVGRLEPIEEEETTTPNDDEEPKPLLSEFVNSVVGNNIPPNYIPAIEKGYQDCLDKGPLIGHPIERVRMIVLDGAYHAVDSSEYAFRLCSHGAFKEAFMKANPGLLEPIMDVEITAPNEYQPSIVTLINKRRGQILNSTIEGTVVRVEAEVPLALMFGYSTDLRSATEGKGEFSMTYKKHYLVPKDRLDGIIEDYKRKAEREAKREAKEKW